MSSDASSTLSPEIQQAIQQAVGDVNDAVNVSKKKKKRNREQAETDQSDKPRKQHKKKKQRTEGDGTSGVTIEQSSTATSNAASDIEAVTRNDDTPLPEKKKKRRKDKGKEKAQEEPVAQVQPESIYLDNDSAASSVDFLSLVVAAANATASAQPQEQQPPPTGYPTHMQQYPQYPEQYLAYPPPPGYPYPPPAHYSAPPPNVCPELPGLAIPDLNITTSEELLQTLQSMDITKIASVLKSLGDVGTAANVTVNNAQQATQPVVPGPLNPAPIRQTPAKSEAILGHAPRPAKKKVFPAPPAPPPGDEHNPSHAHMLATVWLNPGKLAELVKREGLVYKKGKFSAIEEALLEAAIARFRESRGITEEQLIDIIFSKEKGRDSFWTEITSALHLRPIIAVYHHVRRNYHPMAKRGKWTDGEDKELERAVNELGLQWERIASRVCRAASDCRDRYRNHILDRSIRVAGPWSKAEEELLTEIVTEMTVKQGKNMDNDVFWSVVSERMGNRRGRQQCRIKWTDSLSTQYKNDGQRPRWSALDAYILVRKIDSLSIHDDTEIDWKTLPDDEWNYWSAHSLQRRWLNMKRGIRGFEEMSHAEIMEILRTKKGQFPPEISQRKRAKVTSAEAVDDSEDEDADDDNDWDTNDAAGPSSQGIPPPVIAMLT